MAKRVKTPTQIFSPEPLRRCESCRQPIRGEEFEGDLHVLLHALEVMLAPDTKPDERRQSVRVLKRLVDEIRVDHEVWTPGPYVQ